MTRMIGRRGSIARPAIELPAQVGAVTEGGAGGQGTGQYTWHRFVTTTAKTITQVKAKPAQNISGTLNVRMRIRASASPYRIIATSLPVAMTSANNGQLMTFDFPAPFTLASGTYILEADMGASAAHCRYSATNSTPSGIISGVNNMRYGDGTPPANDMGTVSWSISFELIGVGSASNAFPVAVSPLAWFKAEDLSLADNAAVASWHDASGNSRDAAQATGANQPLLQTAEFGTKPGVQFDGSNDLLVTPSFAVTLPFHVFVVAKLTAPGSGFNDNVFGGGSAWGLQRITNTDFRLLGPTTGTVAVADPTIPHLFTARWAASSGSYLRLDRAATAIAGHGHDGSGLNNALALGNRPDGLIPAPVTIAELIVCGALTDQERDAIEAYLKVKWGTP